MDYTMKHITTEQEFADSDFDVCPNIAEPTEWRRWHNLKNDRIDKIIRAYRNEIIHGMAVSRTIPISELTQRYGNPNSKKTLSQK